MLFPFARDRLADFIERNPDEIENVIEFLKTAAESFLPPFKGVALEFFIHLVFSFSIALKQYLQN